MTIDSVEIIKTMLENNGVYPGDPQAASIWQYSNWIDEVAFAVFMRDEDNDIMSSPYVQRYVLLWSPQMGVTPAGQKLLS